MARVYRANLLADKLVGSVAAMPAAAPPRTRDAERSRAAILDAAESRFAAHGFERTSLADVGAAAGLSRGTPAYFFGSKDALYAAVIDRVFAERDAVLRHAFEPLHEWAAAPRPAATLEDVLGAAVDAYLAFLTGRPAFVALCERESLAGGRLAATPHESSAIADALGAVRGRHGLARFDVAAVLTAFVALCFFPVAHRDTFLPAIGIDPADPEAARRRRDQVVSVVAHLVR